MSQLPRRRSLRLVVLAATMAATASFVVAPPAQAGPASDSAPSGSASTTTSANTATDTPAGDDPSTAPTPTADPTSSAPPEPTPHSGGEEVTPTSVPEVPADAPTTESAAGVDSGDTVVGELVQAFVDPAGHLVDAHDDHAHDDGAHDDGGEQPLSWIRTGDGAAVQVVTEDVPSVAPGSTLAVTVGDEQEPAVAGAVEEGAREVLAASVLDVADTTPTVAPAGGAPTNTVTAVLVVPSGGAPSATTIDQVVDELNGEVSSFWDEQSNGAIRIAAVAGSQNWVYSSASCTSSGYAALMNDVAGQIGWTAGAGKHLMAYIPDWNRLCGGAYGMGEVKARPSSGGTAWVGGVALDVMAHELGHNFGLGHSSEYQCNSAVETGTCQTVDYADYYDVMGFSWGQVGSLNAAQAARLGVLPAAEQVGLTPTSAATTVSLAPASAASGTRAIKLTSGGVVYYLEYRQASGQDAWLADSRNRYGVGSGVTVRTARSGNNTSLLLDGTPSPSSGWAADRQQALPVGAAVSLAGGAFSVTVSSVSASGAAVDVVGGQSPNSLSQPAKPVGTLDGITVRGRTVSISGWAVDPDAASTSIQVHVYVDGRGLPLVANADRAEADSVPGAGRAHGFLWNPVLDPGRHDICVYAIDVARGPDNTVLGCRGITVTGNAPVGTVDTLTVTGTQLDVAGWAFDPDAPQQDIQVHVYVDGRGVGLIASQSSPSGALTAGHRFSWRTTLGSGAHSVCVYALDSTPGQPNTTMTCQTVTVVTYSPVGALDSISVTSTGIQVSGWAVDPDAPGATAQVHMYVDARGAVLLAGDTSSSSDVTSHRFSGVMSASPGEHQVCVYAIDVTGGPSNTQLACRSVRVG